MYGLEKATTSSRVRTNSEGSKRGRASGVVMQRAVIGAGSVSGNPEGPVLSEKVTATCSCRKL